MKNDPKILEFHREQIEFGFIESVSIYKNIEDIDMTTDLTLTLFNYPYVSGDRKMLVTFYDVKELSLGELEGLFKTVFSITNISSFQMENINYRVVEDENNLMRFNCKDFKFSFIENEKGGKK